MQAGHYDDAIQRYERIVSRDACSRWLGQKLIQSRLSRMAENTNEALDFLMDEAKVDSISDALYGDYQIEVSGDSIGAETQGMVRTAVQSSFAQTAWYDARGKLKLEGKVESQFNQSKNKTGLVLIQTYKGNENYVENVPVEKHRQVPQRDHRTQE